MISISEAFKLIQQTVKPMPIESVTLADSVDRVLAADVCSDVDSPPHDKSVMDGYAVMSQDIADGRREFEVVETIAAGAWPRKELTTGCAARIMTGAPMPPGADAVVMIEQTESKEVDGRSRVTLQVEELKAGKHMMPKASNISVGETVFSTGHQIRPTDIGLLAETGAAAIQVFGNPEIAVLPTGDELVRCDEKPNQGLIRNSNGPMLVAMARSLGLQVQDLGIGRDNESELTRLISKGLESDVLLLSGGVSMGEFDLVPPILAKAGVEQVFHKVAVKPGKPIWFGVLNRPDRPTYVFGLPGNPVSSLVGFHLFVRTALRIMTGNKSIEPSSVVAELSLAHEARGDRPTYWPGRWVQDESAQRKFEPLQWQGSSDLTTLGQAEALAYFSAGTKTHPAGEAVRVFPL